jgi:hypothetical protein
VIAALIRLLNTPFAFGRVPVQPRPDQCQEHPPGHPECDITIWAGQVTHG